MNEKYTLEHIAEIIEVEGLEEAITQQGIDGADIEDGRLGQLWEEARRILNEIDSIIAPYM